MKIKVCFGIDTRLWRHNIGADQKPDEATYRALCDYVCDTFQFESLDQFSISLREEGLVIAIANASDLEAAYVSAQSAKQKSLKLYIALSPNKVPEQKVSEEKEAQPLESCIGKPKEMNSKAVLHSFFSDDQVSAKLSDLFIAVLTAMKECNCEIPMVQCLEGVLLSSNNEYACITSHNAWPQIRHELLPKYASFVEFTVAPMLQSNMLNIDQLKQLSAFGIQMMKQSRFGAPNLHPMQSMAQAFGQCNGPMQNAAQQREGSFVYTQQMADIMNMGFANAEVIKQLLMKHRGNTAAVVDELFQSNQ